MAKHIISKPAHKTWNINKSDDTWVLGARMTVSTLDGVGINVAEPFSGNTITVNRNINMLSGNTKAISVAGDNTTVRIAAASEINALYGIEVDGDSSSARINNAGTIRAQFGVSAIEDTTRAVIINRGDILVSHSGIRTTGANSQLNNIGDIIAGSYGMFALGTGSKLYNSGFIQSDIPVYLGGEKISFTNYAGGVLRGDIGIYADNNSTMTIVNKGTIIGYSYAIAGDAARLNIANTGTIYGNVILGNDNDVFDTRAGSFIGTVYGHGGDDIIKLRSAGQKYVEDSDEGTDTVQIAVSYTLGANIENLTLLGKVAINGTGNDLDNVLTGNAVKNTLTGGLGKDTLSGGGGNDILIGGMGDDTAIINNTGVTFTEADGGGTDTVKAGISYTLGANIENLELTGTKAINGKGNELNNVLTGNNAANVLSGGEGNDTLTGGTGADIFIYANSNGSDVITDFIDNQDMINLSVTGFSSFDSIAGLLEQVGNDVVIAFGGGNTLTVQNIMVGDLTAADFLFN